MKNILVMALALMLALAGYSQNPYQGVTTISADGITFDVEVSQYNFFLSSAANINDNGPWYYQDGQELETLDEYEIIDAKQLPGGQYRAIREAFGDAVIASLRAYKECPMSIFYVIGPEGDTLEVAFIMDAAPELLSLSPKVFATLEQKLKKYVKWEVNEYGRKLKYFHGSMAINFKKIMLDSELHRIKPDLIPDPDPGLTGE